MISAGSIGEVPIVLAKPQSYMNYSGEAVCISDFIIVYLLYKFHDTYNYLFMTYLCNFSLRATKGSSLHIFNSECVPLGE